ncbi:MAG TPA: NADH-quinone oxidoreductase subunit L, partial [Acidimicrobiia bacterium]
MTSLLWLIIALPLASAGFLHFFGRRIGEPRTGYLATLSVAGSFALGLGAGLPFFSGGAHPTVVTIGEWMPAIGASFVINWDPLSVLMTLIITGVGALIHLYAVGYMHGDPRFSRFFVYLNLFVASMLTLVLAGNFAMLFLGWELVGLCSYLLISFWFT